MENIISAGLAELGLSPAGAEPLARYGRLLLEKNQVMNLTAIRDEAGVAQLHMLDCAALLKFCAFENKSLIDVGTGAGFPGMVLKVLAPTLKVTLLDSLSKRLDWLEEVSAALKLDGVNTVHGRAEELGLAPEFRERFDLATSRAVADMSVLCELCLPFVKTGGAMIAMKAVDCEAELDRAGGAIRLLGGAIEELADYAIPGTQVKHRLVLIRKKTPTPKGYPRRWAKIQKTPL